ncbi:heparan-alpha-glucosaminide N-acetyltransferase [Pseudonocardia sp. TMWB2A]|uniref:acyltransferase family protein n=1 Tax=Pseudonocardia sp. TMWB2A TaxID=687430 RepID=UPI00307F90C7
MKAPRDLSLDAFRGVDVLLMVLVNLQGAGTAFGLLKHAEWNGLTLADLVFPWFLLMVGLSLPLALDKARTSGAALWPAIMRRTLLLFAIGVLLGWLIRPTLEMGDIRWTGVLQRIAIVYGLCAAIVMVRKGAGFSAALAALILLAHSLLLLKVGTPDGGAPSLAAGEGLAGWLDQHILPGRAHRGTWDPEGLLSTLPSIASGLIGVAVMQFMRARGLQKQTGTLAVLGVILVAIGVALMPILPLNKSLWTASFALVTAGMGLLVWALLYNQLAATGLAPPLAALLFSLVTSGLCCAAMPFLKRKGWVLKL